ncbi:hypothetical protein CC85DRAFT_169604 [Cutaneotrichosporon oleaginosum]|uniref:Uncharacterized protein n=1 Tax=Cutaneotrichosporon oleaginosum TaxID=879819 RepID=A0A0J0XVC5_9TREE|nr:uncharacterized protein CC85DRAFT_169604 [Cutaneotrichosporon oleaginosum]KLT45011.1 hypothetical protein CC85DRAFT_169604 [Cutaneotrichosporon oleaginosum]TXT09699.1 hypothetical protein COLE_03633 [Cutaneotrichosporon oleaginosum]
MSLSYLSPLPDFVDQFLDLDELSSNSPENDAPSEVSILSGATTPSKSPALPRLPLEGLNLALALAKSNTTDSSKAFGVFDDPNPFSCDSSQQSVTNKMSSATNCDNDLLAVLFGTLPDASQPAPTGFEDPLLFSWEDTFLGQALAQLNAPPAAFDADADIAALASAANASKVFPVTPNVPIALGPSATTSTSSGSSPLFAEVLLSSASDADRKAPLSLASPAPSAPNPMLSLKRKLSETEDADLGNAGMSAPVRTYKRRQSTKVSPTLQQMAAAASTGSPVFTETPQGALGPSPPAPTPGPVKARKTATVRPKAATARPKATVPEKYMADAQQLSGMSRAQILSYPTFEALLRDVDEARLPPLIRLGEQITLTRARAADSAQKSREEAQQRKDAVHKLGGQVKVLEDKVDTLNGKLDSVRTFLLEQVHRGVFTVSQVQQFL